MTKISKTTKLKPLLEYSEGVISRQMQIKNLPCMFFQPFLHQELILEISPHDLLGTFTNRLSNCYLRQSQNMVY